MGRKWNEQAYLTQKKTKEEDKISLVHEMLLNGRKLFVLHVEDTDIKTQKA